MRLFLYFILSAIFTPTKASFPPCATDNLWHFLTDTNQSLQTVPPDLSPVAIHLEIIDLHDLDQMNGKINVQFILTMMWNDTRLNKSCQHAPFYPRRAQMEQLWVPDFFIANGLKTTVQNAISGYPALSVTIETEGQMRFISSIDVVFPCTMDFVTFPHDSMTCMIELIPIPYNMPTQLQRVGILKDHYTLGTHSIRRIAEEPIAVDPLKISDATVLRVKFVLDRYVLAYVFRTGIPMTFTAVVAWLGFFVDPSSIPARATLGISTLLALIFEFNSEIQTVPRVGYIKIVDVWITVIFATVFGAIAEFAYVCHLSRISTRKDNHDEASLKQKSARIDFVGKIAFPLVLILNNAITVILLWLLGT